MNNIQPNISFLEREITPRMQAIYSLIGGIIFIFIAKITGFPSYGLTGLAPWVMAVSFLLVFVVFNSLFLIPSTRPSVYITESVLCYIILAIILGGLAYLVSGIPPSNAGTITIIFYILSSCYVVFLSISSIMKRMKIFLDKEEKDKIAGKTRRRRKRR